MLHIPSTFGPIAPETAPPPPPPATHYEFPRSAELQSIQALIIAYTNRDVCLVCHVTGDTQYPETHSLGRCRSRLAGAQDQTYKVWRQTAFNFEFGKECMGCGVPKDVNFFSIHCILFTKPLAVILFGQHQSKDPVPPSRKYGK